MAGCSSRSSTTGAGFDVESARHAGHGLANVSERIAAHGGTLVVESAPGRGTTVRANIPVADAAAQRIGLTAHSGTEDRSGSSRLPPPLGSGPTMSEPDWSSSRQFRPEY